MIDKTNEERVKIILEEFTDTDDGIKNTDNLGEDLGIDSLDFIEIIMGIEEEFDINIPDKDADELKTVQNLIDYVSR